MKIAFPRCVTIGLLARGLMFTLSAQEIAPPAPQPKPDPWLPLRPLIGSWEGDVQAEPGKDFTTRPETRFRRKSR